MKNRLKNKTTRNNFITYGVVILIYIVMQILTASGSISSTMQGLLVPICAYVVMAISLNLTVGILGELSLGHAGFMSVGAFTGVTAAMALSGRVSSGIVCLIVGMVVSHRHPRAAAEGRLSGHRDPGLWRDHQGHL